MSLNIKDPKAHKLAKSLSKRTGKPMARIVVEALEREDAALKHAASAKKRSEEGLRIAARIRTALGGRKVEPDTSLYGDDGLPK
jgi:antitoxin VapB